MGKLAISHAQVVPHCFSSQQVQTDGQPGICHLQGPSLALCVSSQGFNFPTNLPQPPG